MLSLPYTEVPGPAEVPDRVPEPVEGPRDYLEAELFRGRPGLGSGKALPEVRGCCGGCVAYPRVIFTLEVAT